MGNVWLAEDLLLRRRVAMKQLLPSMANDDQYRDELRSRALNEARAMARVHHAAIVPIHDILVEGKEPWIVMQYIHGRSLHQVISEHVLSELQLAKIGLPVLSGLEAVHQAGMLHRDIKPANILISEAGSVFLADFGIAKITGGAALTGRQIIGTPEFMAPERLLGYQPMPAADIWSLGVTFFCAMEGYSPFLRGDNASAERIIASILRDEPPPMMRGGRLAGMIGRLLDKDPAERPDITEIRSVLESVISGSPA